MTSRETDVLVVGLGPAGTSAATAAARAGLNVLALDRRREIGLPVQCAEWVPLPLGAQAKAEGVLRQAIDRMATYLPSGTVSHAHAPGLMIDRAAFDRTLAEAAHRAGAQLWRDSALIAIDRRARVATVRNTQVETRVRYRALIAADGPRSTVARCLGLPPLPVVFTRQYTVPLLRDERDTAVWLSDDYVGGYAWLFPKGGVANLGVGGGAAVDLKPALDRLHRQMVAEGRVGGEILFRTGGEIPVGGLRARLADGDILFVGDAGGFTHPVTGAGIASAVASGEYAGTAAARYLSGNAHAPLEYESEMRDQYEASLRRAVAQREALWRAESRCDPAFRRGWVAFEEYFQPML